MTVTDEDRVRADTVIATYRYRWHRDSEAVMRDLIAAAIAEEREKVTGTWLGWLISVDYGVDYGTTPPPPVDIRDLAEVYAETNGEPVAEWVEILEDSNGHGWETTK